MKILDHKDAINHRKDSIYRVSWLTARTAAMRYILKAESYDRRGKRRKTVLDNSRKRYNRTVLDSILNSNPLGELTIYVPESAINPYATVICIDIDS